jgi:uncharacterized membrane protein
LGKVSGLVFRIGLVALVGLCLAYPVAMLDHKTNGFKPVTGRFTLDGMTFIPEAQREAINWLKQAELGVLVEAIGEGGGSYSPEAGRFSAFSGQPTVLGWYGHEDQWRGSNEGLLERQSAVETLYTTRSWVDAQAIIDRYQIRYILVSNYERARYPVDETKFQAYLKTAFQSGDVTIYETPQYHIAMQGVP